MPVERRPQIPCSFEVFGNQGGVFVGRPGVLPFDRDGQAPVQLGASGLQLRLIGHRPDQRVPKRILGARGKQHLIDKLHLQQLGHRLGHVRVIQ